MASFIPISTSEAPNIASYSLHSPKHLDIQVAQTAHRIRIINIWQIAPESRVIEIGCGQGDATGVLAHAVGPHGHVDAVDPGALDYGAPFTLAQAQGHLSKSLVGDRISWHQATPEKFLQKTGEEKWDVAVLAHCIWYFASPSTLGDILSALRGRVGRVCIAEYAGQATEKAAIPHVWAAVASGSLARYSEGESTANIRSPSTPEMIKRAAFETGWDVEGSEHTIIPERGLLDGSWEVGTVTSNEFSEDVAKIKDENNRRIVMESRNVALKAVEELKGERPRTMDVWIACFVPRK